MQQDHPVVAPALAPPVPMPRWVWHSLLRFSGITALNDLYSRLPVHSGPACFAAAALAELGVSYSLSQEELQHVPAEGPVVITVNHPFGGVDGLIAIAGLLQRRPDLKVLATASLAAIAPLAPLLVPVDNFRSRASSAANARALLRAVRDVAAGGALLVFPAGEVAHFDLRARCVTDPPWSAPLMGLLRRVGAPVVPAYIEGANSRGFQLAGLVHPALRTALLPRELTNKRGLHVQLRFGPALSSQRVASVTDNERLACHLRLRTYSLALPAAGRSHDDARALPVTPSGNGPCELAAPADADGMRAEVAALGGDARLASATALEVYCAPAARIPQVLHEIGRLRELTFRAVGEGTGQALDLDRFDAYYDHLFVWDPARSAVVGAYRIGRIDEIRRNSGRGSLYIESLFELLDPFVAILGPALELGRSFVRPEYQKSFAPLLALWRGIGEYVGREPRYARLIGPVSISAAYDGVSRELLVRYARRHHFDPLLASMVRPRHPFRPVPGLATLGAELGTLQGIEALSELLSEREPDGKGVPVLLRQYLKLGGRILGFNIDPQFGHCIDFLTLVDLRRSPHAALARYMRPESLQRFRHFHRGRTERGGVAA